jgi:hypothetical protein
VPKQNEDTDGSPDDEGKWELRGLKEETQTAHHGIVADRSLNYGRIGPTFGLHIFTVGYHGQRKCLHEFLIY